MITKDVTIEIASGTDARETAMLVQIASRYKSSLYLKSKEKTFNAKSIMGMMTLGLKSGDTLLLRQTARTRRKQSIVLLISLSVKNPDSRRLLFSGY